MTDKDKYKIAWYELNETINKSKMNYLQKIILNGLMTRILNEAELNTLTSA